MKLIHITENKPEVVKCNVCTKLVKIGVNLTKNLFICKKCINEANAVVNFYD